ncbi:MAG: hypothetical protein SNF33_03575 [Candidatus Algichlamydia australiensis]|nr:hypothetical protein [Chlamydiales bacterium]
MILQGLPLIRLTKWVDLACLSLIALTFFSPLVLFYFVYQNNAEVHSFVSNRIVGKKKSFDYEQIGTGALAIESNFAGLSLPKFDKEVLLVSSNPQSKRFLFGLRGSFEKRESQSGEKHYLTYGKGGELRFSKSKTPFSITPTLIGEKLEFDAELFIDSSAQAAVNEVSRFVAAQADQEETARFLGEGIFGKPFVAMESARLLGPDQLFVLYGGEEYAKEAGSARLLFDEGILFVQKGDLLFFDEKEWKLASGETKNHFLAKILTTSPERVDAEISDEKGLLKRRITIQRKPKRTSSFRAGELFTGIRPRTATTVSLKIAGESSHLKRGDWLLKVENQWRRLEDWEEVEELLCFERRGELFVFDGIVKSGGAQFFSGHYFDAMRERSETIRLPLTVKEKRVKKKASSRRPTYSPSEKEDFDDDDEELDF